MSEIEALMDAIDAGEERACRRRPADLETIMAIYMVARAITILAEAVVEKEVQND